jgi:hypothetical protein
VTGFFKIYLKLLTKFLTPSCPGKHKQHCTNKALIAITKQIEFQLVNKRLLNNIVKWLTKRKLVSFANRCIETDQLFFIPRMPRLQPCSDKSFTGRETTFVTYLSHRYRFLGKHKIRTNKIRSQVTEIYYCSMIRNNQMRIISFKRQSNNYVLQQNIKTLWRRSLSKCYLRIQSVPQREHHTSPLQRSSS